MTHPSTSPPWDADDLLPTKPRVPGFGYHDGRRAVGCSRQELMQKCAATRPRIDIVWTPDEARLVPPHEVDFLRPSLLSRVRSEARRRLVTGVVWGALCGVMAVQSEAGSGERFLWVVLALGFGLVRILGGLTALIRRTDPEEMAPRGRIVRFRAWLSTRPPMGTLVLTTALVVVWFVSSAELERAVEAAGLVKTRVWEGEPWRLVTHAFLHAGLLHILFNGVALHVLGALVEGLAGRALMSLTFLLSILGGGLLSLLASPETTSVGASGGVLGLLGFLAALGWRHRESLPPGFFGAIALNVGFIGVLGVLGHGFIDNAGHLGGLLTGAVIALLMAPVDEGLPVRPGPSSLVAGRVAMGSLVAFAVLTAWRVS